MAQRNDRPTSEKTHRPRRRALTRRAVGLTAVAAGATAVAVAGGLATSGVEDRVPTASLAAATGESSEGTSTSGGTSPLAAPPKLTGEQVTDEKLAEAQAAREATVVSRSDTRAKTDPAKESSLEVSPGRAVIRTESLADEDPRTIGRALLGEFGYGADQWSCLDSLWTKESGWQVDADNPTSSAYGIPQSLPGSKMASEGADWATNPVTQIRWGLGYIKSRYGTPCAAWGHSQARNWY